MATHGIEELGYFPDVNEEAPLVRIERDGRQIEMPSRDSLARIVIEKFDFYEPAPVQAPRTTSVVIPYQVGRPAGGES